MGIALLFFYLLPVGARGSVVVYATSQKVAASIPAEVSEFFSW
jgi:hypothetical protein